MQERIFERTLSVVVNANTGEMQPLCRGDCHKYLAEAQQCWA